MISQSLQAIILAAGRSRRFKTEQTKLGFLICGQEMILYPIKLLRHHAIPITLVVGHQKEYIQEILAKNALTANYAEQQQQQGTGHALLCSRNYWQADNLLVMHGDVPLLSEACILELMAKHANTNATITFITAHNSDPSLEGYGLVIKKPGSIRVLEEPSTYTPESCCVNPGIYLIKREFLEEHLEKLTPKNPGEETYISELVGTASAEGHIVETVHIPFDQVRGVNTLKELWTAEHIKRSELIAQWMAQGVQFSTPQNVQIDIDVTIGSNTRIGANAVITRGTRIGENCHIDAFVHLENAVIGDNVSIFSHSTVQGSVIQNHAQVGPFAHIHSESLIGTGAIVGNFVETRSSTLGTCAKIKHMAYIGSAEIGADVTIGAGTVTSDFDGFKSHKTSIKDHVLINAHSTLVAPATIGSHAIVAPGSVITEIVPAHGFATSDIHQVTKGEHAFEMRQDLHKKATGCTESCHYNSKLDT